MVSALWKKLLRDAWESHWSFFAVICICALGIGLFSGIHLYLSSITSEIDTNYDRANLADYWIYKAEVTQEDANLLQALPEIAVAERRKTVDGSLSGNHSGVLRLHGMENDVSVNIPKLIEGESFDNLKPGELLLDSEFAKAGGIHVGDTLRLSVPGGEPGDWQVRGIVCSAEYLYYTPDGLTLPNPNTHGFAYVNADSLPDLPWNEMGVTLAGELSHEAAMELLRGTLGSANIIGRMNQFSVGTIQSDIDSIGSVGTLLPVLFLLLAVLVTWIVVGRMLEQQRQHLGTLRSLGLGRASLTARYSLYGVIITLPATALGWLLSRSLGGVLYEMGASQYALEQQGVRSFSSHFVLAAFCVLSATCAAAFLSCRRALRDTPATLMRPKPPAQGHRILLERFRGYWRRLSFSGKIVTRNLLRNKSRLFMGLIGVAGSAALLVCGFGIRDSMDCMVTHAFESCVCSDMEIKLRQSISREEMVRLLPGVENLDAAMAFTVYLYGDEGNVQNPYLVVLEDDQTSLAFAGEDGAAVVLPDHGVLITPRLSRALGVMPGDVLSAERIDGTVFSLTVANIVDFPVGNEIYMSRAAFAVLSDETFVPKTWLVRGDSIDITALQNDPRVALIETTVQMEGNMQEILQFTRILQAILILFAGSLALAVMMVLGRLNFDERVRELATLKVLGFHKNEMKRLVLRENLWITLLALPVGLLAGHGLLHVLVRMSVTPESEPTAYLDMMSLVLVCALALGFTLLVNFLMSHKFRRIDMVASLKSVE